MNQGLWRAGINVWSCISGLNMLIIMNTVARTVENERIQRYRHRRYVNRPAASAKNEYQRRVSPIVLNGGLSRLSHKPAMKTERTSKAEDDNTTAAVRQLRFLPETTGLSSFTRNETTAPAAERSTADMPNHMKAFQVIISFVCSSSFRTVYEKKHCSSKHHQNTGNCSIFPRFADNLQNTI